MGEHHGLVFVRTDLEVEHEVAAPTFRPRPVDRGNPRPVREWCRDERVVADRRSHDQEHTLRDELGERLLDRERSARGEAQSGGVDELDIAIEPAALEQIVDRETHEPLHPTAEQRVVRRRVGHVMQDSDAHRCGHGRLPRTVVPTRETTRM